MPAVLVRMIKPRLFFPWLGELIFELLKDELAASSTESNDSSFSKFF